MNENGTLSHTEVISSVIVDCNDLVCAALSGQYLKFCGIAVGLVQKLAKLRDGIETDIKDKDATIAHLKEIINDLSSNDESNE